MIAADLETTGLSFGDDAILSLAWSPGPGRAYSLRAAAVTDWESWLPDSGWFNGEGFDLPMLAAKFGPHLLDVEINDAALMAAVLQKPFGSLSDLVRYEFGVQHEGYSEMVLRLAAEAGMEYDDCSPKSEAHRVQVNRLSGALDGAGLLMAELQYKSCEDVDLLYRLLMRYQQQLHDAGLWETWLLEKSVGPAVRRIKQSRIHIDMPYLHQLDCDLGEEIDSVSAQMAPYMEYKVIPYKRPYRGAAEKIIPPNPRSVDQQVWALRKMGLRWPEETESGKPQLTMEILNRLRIDAVGEVREVIDYTVQLRRAVKVRGTWIAALLREQVDGTVSTSLNQIGAAGGRFSSGGDEEKEE